MSKAARAIVVQDGKILVMHRNKYGSEYFTLVGGRVNEGESLEQALVREVREETGLSVTGVRLVFIEEHPAPYNEQYIFWCEVAPNSQISVQPDSEEGYMNRLDANTHTPKWVNLASFQTMAFRTPALQKAILDGLKHGFAAEPVKL